MSANDQSNKTRVSVTHNQTYIRSQEPDSMDALFQDELLDNDVAEQDAQTTSQPATQARPEGATEGDTDAFGERWDDDFLTDEELAEEKLADDEEMTIVDPLIDKASREADDSDLDDDLDDSEFDDDVQLDELDEFMAEDPEKADDLLMLDDASMGDDDLEPLLDKELEKAPLTASQQALEARRAIEERAERRRMERDLNYLDFELDD